MRTGVSILWWMSTWSAIRNDAQTGFSSCKWQLTSPRPAIIMSIFVPAPKLAEPQRAKSRSTRRALRLNLSIALFVWTLWLIFGGRNALHHLLLDWKVALTMVFGSIVGGGTSEGGGAIAFPIFTKLLHIAPYDARNFSLAIQSVGMGAASLSILWMRVPIEKRALLYAGVPPGTAVPSSLVRTSLLLLCLPSLSAPHLRCSSPVLEWLCCL